MYYVLCPIPLCTCRLCIYLFLGFTTRYWVSEEAFCAQCR